MIAFNVKLLNRIVRVSLYRLSLRHPFYARWRYAGRQFKKSTDEHLEHAARASARRLVTAEMGIIDHPSDTLEALINSYITARWPTKESQGRNYKDQKHRLGRFTTYLDAKCRFASLDFQDATGHIQRHLYSLQAAGLSAQSIVNHQRIISVFCNWLRRNQKTYWPSNPAEAKLLDLPKVIHRIKAPLSNSEAQGLLQAARGKLIHPVVVLALGCGIRPAGILRLKWGDIDLKQKTLRLEEKNRERHIPLANWVAKELVPGDATSPIWPKSQDSLCYHVRTLAAKTDAKKARLYDARKTYLWKLYEANVSPQLAANLAGNSVPVIERHYVSMETLNARAAARKVSYETRGKKRGKIKPSTHISR